jgi:hypothetical protein
LSADFDRAHRDRPLTRILEEEGRRPDQCPICTSGAILERSGRFPEAWVERLVQSVDLERLAVELRTGGPNGLKRSGGSWVGECPLCRGDAFNVTPKKGLWKCFKCGEGGNVTSLVMAIEQCGFPEALRYLAKFTGTALEYENERQKLRCTKAGCEASTTPLDEVSYLMFSRKLDRAAACVVWLQEAGIKRGEAHSPSLMVQGRRRGRVHEVVNEVNKADAPTPSVPIEPTSHASEAASAPPAENEVLAPAALPSDPVEPRDPDVVPFPTPPVETPTTPTSADAKADSKPVDPAMARVFLLDETEIPKAAIREFWEKLRWMECDAVAIWKRRGLTPHTARVAGLRSNDRSNLDVLKALGTKYPIDVLVEVGLWQRHEPDGPAWLQSESEAGVQVIGGARPSEFFYGKGQVGMIKKGREKVPQYDWNRAPIIPYWRATRPDTSREFVLPKALITEGEFKALAVWQVHGVSPSRLASMPDPNAADLLALRPHKHWSKGASPLPYLCPDGNLPLRVAALPGITFCRLKGGSWPVRYHLDEWLKMRAVREVMIAYDNDDRVSRWHCPACGNTDVAIHRARLAAEAAAGEDLLRSPRGLRTAKPTCCGKPMKENPGFKEDESDRWDAVLYAIVLGQELEKLGLDARFMLIPDEMRDRETGKCDWDSSLSQMLFSRRQEELPIESGPPTNISPEEPDDSFSFESLEPMPES